MTNEVKSQSKEFIKKKLKDNIKNREKLIEECEDARRESTESYILYKERRADYQIAKERVDSSTELIEVYRIVLEIMKQEKQKEE